MKRLVMAFSAIVLAFAGLTGTAHAVTGSMQTTTNGQYSHTFTVEYTCVSDGTITFTFTSAASGSGTGTLTPAADGGGAFAFSGTSGTYGYTYGGSYDASGAWYDHSASDTNGVTYTSAQVPGSFFGIPSCGDAPTEVAENHGQCVSASAKAGKTGRELAAIAKDVTLVGPSCARTA